MCHQRMYDDRQADEKVSSITDCWGNASKNHMGHYCTPVRTVTILKTKPARGSRCHLRWHADGSVTSLSPHTDPTLHTHAWESSQERKTHIHRKNACSHLIHKHGAGTAQGEDCKGVVWAHPTARQQASERDARPKVGTERVLDTQERGGGTVCPQGRAGEGVRSCPDCGGVTA